MEFIANEVEKLLRMNRFNIHKYECLTKYGKSIYLNVREFNSDNGKIISSFRISDHELGEKRKQLHYYIPQDEDIENVYKLVNKAILEIKTFKNTFKGNNKIVKLKK